MALYENLPAHFSIFYTKSFLKSKPIKFFVEQVVSIPVNLEQLSLILTMVLEIQSLNE